MIEPVDTARESAARSDLPLLPAILDAVADGVTMQDSDGRIVYANETAVRMIGFRDLAELLAASPHEILRRFELLDERGGTLSPAALPGRQALAGEAPSAVTVGYRLRETGELRWSQVRATPLRDAAGRVTHAINTFHDVTDRMRIEADLRASEAGYRQLVEAMPQVAWTTDAAGRLVMVNQRWREFAGESRPPAAGLEADDRIHPDDRAELVARWRACVAAGTSLEMTARILRHDGVWRWHLVRAEPIRRADGALEGWIGTSTDIDDERRSRSVAALLAAAAQRLDETLDPLQTADAGADLAVPHVGDWCIIELLRDDGTLGRDGVAGTGWDAQRIERVRARAASHDGEPGLRALREKRLVLTTVDDDYLDSRRSADRGGAAVPAGTHTSLAMPLIARGTTLGAMVVGWTGKDRSYEPSDIELAGELARRIALALSNARLYAAEQRARETAEATAARMAALQRMTRSVAQASTAEEIARIATGDAASALGASSAVMYIERETALHLIAAHGYDERALEPLRRLDVEDSLPLARAFRSRKTLWIGDAAAVVAADDRARAAAPKPANASLSVIPLVVGDRAIGVLGLAFATRSAFEAVDRDLTAAQANVVAQAIERATLTEARERLLADLEAQRNRLETVLRQMPAGVLIADASGTLVLSNAQAGEIWRQSIPTGRTIDQYVEYVGYFADGRRLERDDWPLMRAVKFGETIVGEEMSIVRLDGTRGWISVDAAPVRDRDGQIVAGVSTFTDVTAQRLAADRQVLLAESSAVLASSLDYEETLSQVLRLAVPGLADWAAVDLVGPDGALDRLDVAHVDPAKVEMARELRERYRPDAAAPTGAAAVARTGQPELVPHIPDELFERLPDPEYREIVRRLQLRSYMSVPLIAGGETLGVLTFVAAESGRIYGEDDLHLAEALAARAGAAIQNARLFRDVARFKAILDATLDAVVMIDPRSLEISYVNQGAVSSLGWPQHELLGMAADDVFADLDAERLRALVAPLLERRLGSRTVTIALRPRDGRRLPVEVLLQYVEPPGEDGRVVAIARDISDRVEAQARLQRLAEAEHARAAELNAVIRAMGEGVVVCDARGRIVLANPAAEDLFPEVGRQSYEEVLARLDDANGQAPRLGERGGPVDLRVLGEGERWIELSTYPVASRQGASMDEGMSAAETIVLLRDVSAARQRQTVRDTFIGVLSHELRTPVTTIYAGSKVLARSGGLDEETRRSIFEDIHIEAERLHRLVEDVIALRRFGEEDSSEIGREPVLLQRILPGVVRSEQARWPGVTFDLQMPSGVATVVADPTYVEQVVRNLLSNAAKYGGPASTVHASVEPGEGEVLVRIQDDGPGFPAAEAERLFDLFFRSPSTSGAASGAGIGLFVCARLIRAMGGRIWARALPERGAEFGFALQTMDDGE